MLQAVTNAKNVKMQTYVLKGDLFVFREMINVFLNQVKKL